MATSTVTGEFLSFGKFPFPTFSFSCARQAEEWRAFKLHARDYLRYNKVKWDDSDESMKGYITFRLMITEADDREMLDNMEDDGSLSEEERKQPKLFFAKIEQLKIQKPENEWKYRDELMSGLKQKTDETVHQLRTRIETIVNRCNFKQAALIESYKTLALVRAVKFHEVREWVRQQEDVTYTTVYDYCREMEDKSLQYIQAHAEGRATLAAHTAARDSTVHEPPPTIDADSVRLQQRRNCTYCGQKHRNGDCPAYGKMCNACGKPNHFESQCRSKGRPPPTAAAAAETTPDEDELVNRLAEKLMERLLKPQHQNHSVDVGKPDDFVNRTIFGSTLVDI